MSATPPRPQEPAPAQADVPTLEAPQVYRPLSLLAILAVMLGVAYAVLVLVGGLMPFARAYPRSFVVLLLLAPVLGGLGAVLARQKGAERIATLAALALGGVVVLMGLGGLVAFSGSSPWDLGGWAWVLLFAAVLVSFLALARIRSAEGALAGHNLARWGLYLSLFFGGFYLLYQGGNQFAVANQAQLVARRFVEEIKSDDLPQAFRETIKPGSRPSGSNLKEEIEQGHNAPRGGELGEYSTFSHSPLVQSIRLGGETTIRHKSTSAELKQTGYEAMVRYEVRNDFGRFDVVVPVQSVEVGGRRDWQVVGPLCRMENSELSDQAKEFGQAIADSRVVAAAWLECFKRKQPESAYLLTLPVGKRNAQGRALLTDRPELAALAGFAPAMALHPLEEDRNELRRGTRAFLKGDTFLDPSPFIASPPADKEKQLKEFHDALNDRTKGLVSPELVQIQFATTKRVGGELEVIRLARFLFEEVPGEHGKYYIEFELVCRGTVGDSPALDRFRVAKLRLVKSGAVTTPQMKGPPPSK